MSGKLLDSSTAAALFALHAVASERTLNLSLDYCPLRPPECAWILQLFDIEEHSITTSRAATLAVAVAAALDQVRAKQLA
ncbi:MAG: hypothetical protein K2X87_19260 [Gemmataceae bacterium]|nr:hypothetical protein [Gemmataceae bacterium]